VRTKTYLTTITATLIATFGVVGLMETVGADPDESQLLRGLGGRTFAVQVTNLTGNGPPFGTFSNCYTFNDDGSWIDPLFPVPGTWIQDSTGAATGYTATAFLPIGGGLAVLLVQEGTVTPAMGGGTLQLEASTSASIVLASDPTVVIFPLDDFLSVGHQDNQCGQ
jgi:hypothetical protein